MKRRVPITLGAVAIGAVVLSATGGLVAYALGGIGAAERARHEELAERLFDELEGELSALVAREEARSFLEYRFYYVPADNALGPGLVQSALSRPPDEPWVVGWFQVDPGGEISSPQEPRPSERDLALANGWSDGASNLGELRSVLQDVAWSGLPARPPAPVQAVAKNDEDDSWLLKRGISKRSARAEQVVATKEAVYENFQRAVAQVVEPEPVQARRPDVSVVVGPLGGLRVGEHLVLYRAVEAGDEDSRQGLVLRRDVLAQHLEDVVVADSELRSAVSLAWNGDAPADAAYAFSHRFAEPFTALAVTASIARVPGLVGQEAVTVPLLGGVVGVAVLGGGLALLVAVRAELAWARRRQDFVAAVSHELKTPLTTIRMYAEMLRDGMVPAERHRDYLHTVTMESDRLARLIANVLELARLERGGPPASPVVGPVGPIVAEALEIVRPHAAAAGFTLALDEAPGLPPSRVDRDGVVQIVVNLVDNAIKFAAAGPRLVELRLFEEDGRVVLTVRDHGPGVPRAHLRKVFEPFWRGERELTRRTRGTGIGLALVRGLAASMGAAVQARNHPEGGFEVRLALATGAPG